MNIFNNKKLLIFDYDGTIADTETLHNEAFKCILADYRLKFIYSDIAGLSTEDALLEIFANNNIKISKLDIQKLTMQKRQAVSNLFDEYFNLKNGIVDFLNHAKNFFKLSIVSSGSRKNIIRGLEKSQTIDFFNLIICREDIEFAKPNPEGFLLAFNFFKKIKKSETLIFEDSINGIKAAKNANIEYLNVNEQNWTHLKKLLLLSSHYAQ
jgi:HAD superfamily hydrolase (TIGR01549 family)